MPATKIPEYLRGSVSQYSGVALAGEPIGDVFGLTFHTEQAVAMQEEVRQCAVRGFHHMVDVLNHVAATYKLNASRCS